MIKILPPSPVTFLLPCGMAILVTCLGISLNYYLSWAHMVMAAISLTGGLFLWHLVLLRSQSDHYRSEQRMTNRLAFLVPFFLLGLLPWGLGHWYNLTLPLVACTGTVAAILIFALHQRARKDLNVRIFPLFLGTILALTLIPLIFVFTSLALPHHHSTSPQILLSGKSLDGNYRLRGIPGSTESKVGGHLKWTLRLEEYRSGGWERVAGSAGRGFPAHRSGSWIEGINEQSLRARWTGRNTFEFSYYAYFPTSFGPRGEQHIIYRCVISVPDEPPTQRRDIHCTQETSTATTPLRTLLGWD